VLARLATEEPDLSGLPGDLTELITACMARVPRQRPTSSSMLAQLGDFTEAQSGPDEEHAYLPAAAMALIGEYQRSPQLIAFGGIGEDRVDDATSASYTELPASYKPAPRRKPATGSPGPGGSGWRQWFRSHMAWAGWASVGAALIVAGVILGASLTSSSSPTAGPRPLGPPPPPPTACRGPANASHKPMVCMNRSQGYPSTAFVVEGGGFAPHSSLTVRLTEIDPSNKPIVDITAPVQPVTGADGTFKISVSQIDSSPLPLGMASVEVTGPSGHTISTGFMVIPEGAPLVG
jgi:hypothetical protein